MPHIPLHHRTVIRIAGADRMKFLQGLVTNDVAKTQAGQAVYAMLLTPQGKFLHEMLLVPLEDALLLDVDAEGVEALLKRLTLYTLRADVQLGLAPEYAVYASIAPQAVSVEAMGERSVRYADPRHLALGARLLLHANDAAAHMPDSVASLEAYDAVRLTLGVPDGVRDMIPDKDFPLACGVEALHGVDFHKGCYVGQEVTARSKHRGTLRKALLPVHAEEGQMLPAFGTAITTQDGRTAGELRSSCGRYGLAMLKLEMVGEGLLVGELGLFVKLLSAV